MFKLFKNKIFVIVCLFLLTLIVGFYTFAGDLGVNTGDITGIVLKPFQDIFSKIRRGVDESGESLAQLREENEKLKQDLAAADSKIAEYQRFEALMDDLEASLDLKDRLRNYDFIQADIIARDIGNFANVYVLNKGYSNGIGNNNVVVFGSGVVGKVIWTGYNTARMQLITDPNSSVSARISGNRSLVEVTGDIKYKNQGLCVLRYIDNDVNVKVNDYVETSGLEGSKFPKELLIGKVEKIEESVAKGKLAIVRPIVDLNALETVFVLKEKT